MTKSVFFLYFFLISTLNFGQNDTLKTHVFKFSPLQIFDLDNAFSIAFEKKIKEKRSLQVEAGYGHSNLNLWMNIINDLEDIDRFRGINIFRGRTEIRQYFRSNPNADLKNNYYGIEVFGKYTRARDDVKIGRDPIAGVISYSEIISGVSTKIVTGSHFKLGIQRNLFKYDKKLNNRWIYDAFCGIGFRGIKKDFIYKNKQEKDILPWDIKRTIGTFQGNRDGWRPLISGTAGLKIGFLF